MNQGLFLVATVKRDDLDGDLEWLCADCWSLGVYAEVSGGVELAVLGRVAEVSPSDASRILGKPVMIEDDKRHYKREIANVGMRRKLLVGRPLV